jgi:hypothetical protein
MTPAPKCPVGRPKKPTVGLYDKDGNVKMLHSYEELKTWIDETENSIKEFTGGPKNPDLEPATKGYVKCVARKTTDHEHSVTYPTVGLFIGSAGLMCAWFWMATLHESTLCWITGIGALMMFWIGVCFDFSDGTMTETSNLDGGAHTPYRYPDYLQKYIPPPCEKKEDCE